MSETSEVNRPAHLTDPAAAGAVVRHALSLAATTRLVDVMTELDMTTTEGNDFRADCEWLLIGFKSGVFEINFQPSGPPPKVTLDPESIYGEGRRTWWWPWRSG